MVSALGRGEGGFINGSKKFEVMERMVVVVKHNNRFEEVDLESLCFDVFQ
jgi:hypothetical protein